jgi:hypothetical protein
MKSLLYADLNKKILVESSSGTTSVSLPAITQGDKLQIGLRFLESIDGARLEVQKDLQSIRATIGAYDARPDSGFFVLKKGNAPYVEGVNQTSPIAYNATARALQAALAEIGLGGATVVNTNGSWLISNDGAVIDGLKGNSVSGLVEALRPTSFVRVRSRSLNNESHYEVRLIQAPLASTVDFLPVLPTMPEVKRVQEGGEDAFAKWPEIQSIKILPTFRGTYILRRGFKRTGELSVEDGPAELEAELNKIADDGGSFKVTNPRTNIAHVTFSGTMNGNTYPLIEVVVTSNDSGDPTFTLDTNTIEVADALRGEAVVDTFLEVEATFEEDDETLTTMSLCKTPIKIERDLNWEGLEVASNVDWLRPPIGETYVPFTRDQVIFGSQHYAITLDEADYDNSVFKVTHNLNTTDLHVSVYDQGNNGEKIEPSFIGHESENVLMLDFANIANAENYRVVISSAGPASAFVNHTHTIDQVNGLSLLLSDLGERVEILEQYIPNADVAVTTNKAAVAGWTLPTIFEIFPMRVQPKTDGSVKQEVSKIDFSKLPRGGGLLPAKYLQGSLTVANEFPATPSLSAVYSYTDTSKDLYLPGYLSRKGKSLKAPALYGWDGRGYYQVEQVNSGESVYYPSDFSRELFRIHVNDRQLRTGRQLNLDFGIVAAVFKSNTPVHWAVIIDIGIPTKNPSNPSNVVDVSFLPPSLDYSFILTEVPSTHTFGIKVARTVVNLQDSFIVQKSLYGQDEVTDTVLTSTNFVVRGRLARFDTGNNQPDPRGLVALQGLEVEVEGSDGNATKNKYGVASIGFYTPEA